MEKQLEKHLVAAIKKIPKTKKIGLLFSGGVDSLAIAFYLKKLDYNFTCYTVALKDTNAEDLKYAKELAKELKFKLKTKEVNLKNIPKYLEKVIPIIQNTSPVQVSIALTTYIATELASTDNVDLILTGSAADELFGGYSRHKKFKNLNKELLKGLEVLHSQDIPREKKIVDSFGLQVIAPFLELEEFAFKVPASLKISSGVNKLILRNLLISQGIPSKYALRLKKAAQYGSKFDKAISKLSGKSKTSYLNSFFKVGSLFSSGKDSCYALQLILSQGYTVPCLITIKSSNESSYMYHTPNVDLVSLQSSALDIPLLTASTTGLKEDELKDLEKVLKTAIKKYGINGIVTGALFSEYQASRIAKICDKLGLTCFNPLWHMNQETEMREIIKNNYKIIFSSIAADGLSKEWLGREITFKDIDKLVALHSKNGLNIAGEGGEFESLVLDCPLFKKEIKILDSEVIMENDYTGKFLIKKAKLD